ncbi:MAG TPA: glutathione S-transferase family protein [Alphaproteobacteria bacterium]|nr:glutathione S-transferase family protein [Alphaproteobacteria bacterium]
MAARKAKKKATRKPARKKLTASPKLQAAAKKAAARAARGAPIRRRTSGRAPTATVRKVSDKVVLNGLHLSAPSCKVGLALSMMGIPFEYRHIDLPGGAGKAPEFLAKNRFGQVPVLEHRGLTIAQSNVILQYLADTFGKFAGRTPQERIRVAEWLMWDQDFMHSGVGWLRGFARFFTNTHEEVVKFARARGERALGMLDRHLGTSKFLVGSQPTIADIAVFTWVATADEGGWDMSRWPNVQAWAERMLALPGAAHPYAVMPKENRAAA